MESCVFCKISERKLPSRMVYEDDRIIAFHDIDGKTPVHVLVCPRAHIPTLNDVTDSDLPLLGQMFVVARKIAEQFGIHQSGYRTTFNVNKDAGQTVFHLHLHVMGGHKLDWP